MNHETDLLKRVVAELERRRGELPLVARDSGVPYDTVLRIKNQENDPGYSKVRRLADYLFGTPEHPSLAEHPSTAGA